MISKQLLCIYDLTIFDCSDNTEGRTDVTMREGIWQSKVLKQMHRAGPGAQLECLLSSQGMQGRTGLISFHETEKQ